MSKTNPIPRSKALAVHQWPCDGVARFSVPGVIQPATYSQAWRYIFEKAGGIEEPPLTVDGKVHRTHTRESVRRLANLNRAYAPQIRAHLAAEAEARRLQARVMRMPVSGPTEAARLNAPELAPA